VYDSGVVCRLKRVGHGRRDDQSFIERQLPLSMEQLLQRLALDARRETSRPDLTDASWRAAPAPVIGRLRVRPAARLRPDRR